MGIDAAIGAGSDFLFGSGVADVAAGGVGTLSGAGAADLLAPTGSALFGGETGLAGTALAGGAGTDIAALTGTAGLGAAGTAADFLAAPGASGFNAAALTPGIGPPGGGPGTLPGFPTATPTGVGGTSVFDTGTQVPGFVNSAGGPSAAPANALGTAGGSGGAAGVSAPAGVSGVPDATAAAGASPGAAPAAGAAQPTSSIDQLLGKLSPSNLANGAIDSLTKNPLGVAAGIGGLGYSIYQGQKQTANEKSLAASASTAANNSNTLTAEGNQLTGYLTNGTLPPQFQAQITQAVNDAITQAKSAAAAQGLSSDPTQNTALAAQIAQINNQVPILTSQIEEQLASTGGNLISAAAQNTGLSGQLYQALVANDTTQAAGAGKAIAALAAAFNSKGQISGSGSGGTTVTIG
jgi:hypothetical protein